MIDRFHGRKPFYHTGGIVWRKGSDVPAILNTEYQISSEMYERMRVPVEMLSTGNRTSVPEIEARVAQANAQINVVINEAPIFKRARSGDMQGMIDDINRVEPLPMTRYFGVKGMIDFIIHREISKMIGNGMFRGFR